MLRVADAAAAAGQWPVVSPVAKQHLGVGPQQQSTETQTESLSCDKARGTTTETAALRLYYVHIAADVLYYIGHAHVCHMLGLSLGLGLEKP